MEGRYALIIAMHPGNSEDGFAIDVTSFLDIAKIILQSLGNWPIISKGATEMVYVDDMYKYPMGKYRNMCMSHMIADTTDELLMMARKIGVRVKWLQYPGQSKKEHFDICASKRALAIRWGAVPITRKELALMERDPVSGCWRKRELSPGMELRNDKFRRE
jgi:hypothetical protein